MNGKTPPPTAPIRPIDRFLGLGALIVLAISVLCFVAIIIGTSTGMRQEDFNEGVWPIIGTIPNFGLPIGLVMIITLLGMSFVRNGRPTKDSK
jgi:hypothetical protein